MARVMVATDNGDDAVQILRQLKSHFERLRSSTDPERAVTDFEDFKPDVLILAFDTIEKAQRYYLGLYRLGQGVHQHPHRTVTLCSKDEVNTAFELCKKEYFDDYVLYWPHTHDGPRLAMSIWICCREMMATRAVAPGNAALLAHARQLGELESVLNRQLADGDRHIENARTQLTQASLESLGEWSNSLKGAIHPALAGTRLLAEKLRDIRPVVLVIDDDPLVLKLIEKALQASVYETVFASHSTQALGLLRRMKPDIVLMDVRMPGIDGVSLTQRLKGTPHLAEIPIIMMTGDSRREILVECMEVGAADFVVKPFTRDSLNAKLEKVLYGAPQQSS